MAQSIEVTGVQKYVQISEGTAIINGQVLYIANSFRINDTDLVGAGGGTDYGDYYVYLRPSRAIMEAYYSKKNWEYVLYKFAAGTYAVTVTPPVGNPDEFGIGLITKRLVNSATQLAAYPLNRGVRLINSKDISDGAVLANHLGTTLQTSGTIWTVTGNDIYTGNTGNIGVGAAPGAFKLDVAGTQRVTGLLSATGGIGTTGFLASSSIKTANYTMTVADYLILASAASGTITITLPAASSNTGRQYIIKKTDSSTNSVVISGSGADTIDGGATLNLLAQYQSYTVMSNGTVWYIV